MTAHPVQLRVERSARITRVQVLVRLVLALGVTSLGVSSIFWLLYLEVPAFVALAIRHKGRQHYLSVVGPPLVAGLRWLAGAFAYLCFLTEALPSTRPGPVQLTVEVGSGVTPGAALARLLLALPALLLVAALAFAAAFAWGFTVISTLPTGRVPALFADFFEALVRTEMRLFAYHLCLVDRYPSLEETSAAPALSVG